MTEYEKFERVKRLIKQEERNDPILWYLSYAIEKQFLGGIYTIAPGFFTAVANINQLHLSPGGAVQGFPFVGHKVKAKYLNRLLTTQEEVDEAFDDSYDTKEIQ